MHVVDDKNQFSNPDYNWITSVGQTRVVKCVLPQKKN